MARINARLNTKRLSYLFIFPKLSSMNRTISRRAEERSISFFSISDIFSMTSHAMMRKKGMNTKDCLCQNQFGISKTCHTVSIAMTDTDRNTPAVRNARIFLSLPLKTGLTK